MNNQKIKSNVFSLYQFNSNVVNGQEKICLATDKFHTFDCQQHDDHNIWFYDHKTTTSGCTSGHVNREVYHMRISIHINIQ